MAVLFNRAHNSLEHFSGGRVRSVIHGVNLNCHPHLAKFVFDLVGELGNMVHGHRRNAIVLILLQVGGGPLRADPIFVEGSKEFQVIFCQQAGGMGIIF